MFDSLIFSADIFSIQNTSGIFNPAIFNSDIFLTIQSGGVPVETPPERIMSLNTLLSHQVALRLN